MNAAGKKRGGAEEKARLQPWEAGVVETAKKLKVRGSAANLIRFLGLFGVSEKKSQTTIIKASEPDETEKAE